MIELFGVSLGTFFQLLTAIFSGGILGVLATFYVRNRKLTLDAAAVLRVHYADELERLARRADESDQRHEECELSKRDLRKELDALHDELRGMKRQIAEYSADKLLLLEDRGCPSDVAPHAVASARRVKDITEDK